LELGVASAGFEPYCVCGDILRSALSFRGTLTCAKHESRDRMPILADRGGDLLEVVVFSEPVKGDGEHVAQRVLRVRQSSFADHRKQLAL
jgi:hypothetical protein